jgi:hypothetical protein
MRSAVFGNGMTKQKPVERRIVRREQRLQVVDDLLDDERQFQRGKIAVSRRSSRLQLNFQFAQKLAYLLKTLVHVAENSTASTRNMAAELH